MTRTTCSSSLLLRKSTPGSEDAIRERSVALILDRDRQEVVLIHRLRTGKEYYTLPGGKIEDGESPGDACLREVREETGLEVTLDKELQQLFNLGRVEHYFLAQSYRGQLELGSPEKDHQSLENHYEVVWMPVEQVRLINLLPVEAKRMVEEASKA